MQSMFLLLIDQLLLFSELVFDQFFGKRSKCKANVSNHLVICTVIRKQLYADDHLDE